MNLLLVNYEYPPIGGGAANATYFLARTFTRKKITTVVLTSAFGRLRGYREEEGVHVYRVPALRKLIDRSRLFEMMLFPVAGGMHVGRIIRKHAVEKAIVFFTLPSGPVGYWMKKRHAIPYLVLLRGGDVPGHQPELDRMHRFVQPLRRLILSNAAAIIANDEGLARRSMATDPYPVSVIPNGVDAQFFVPAGHTSHAGACHVLFVGRFSAEKNLFYLLDQYARLESEFPGKVSLRMVGDGPQMHTLKRHAAESGLGKSVTWYGWTTKEQLRELYTTSSCFVNPSFYEGMPNTVLEAMASGLPVVVSDVPGNNTLIEDGRNGYVFDLTKPDAFFEALARMVQDPEGTARMGLQGRQRVVDNYSWDIIAEQFMRFLS